MKHVSVKPFLFCILGLLSCATEPEPDAIPSTAAVAGAASEAVQEKPANRTELTRVAIRHILIAHSSTNEDPSGGERTESQAKTLIGDIRERLLQGEDMAALAKQYSDDSTASRGGFVGAAERGAWVETFEDEAFSLKVDQISNIVQTEYGFHVLRREALHEVKLFHLMVAHKGAKRVARRSAPGKRSVAEARAIVSDALNALDAGEDFSDVSSRFSDGPMAKRGAELGWFVRGELGPKFDAVAFDLEIGDHSRIIETVFGFHLIERAAP